MIAICSVVSSVKEGLFLPENLTLKHKVIRAQDAGYYIKENIVSVHSDCFTNNVALNADARNVVVTDFW